MTDNVAGHAIATHRLTVQFGRKEALKDVDLAVPAGAIFALVGPNGAGKTTLIKTLVNMHRPTHGTATVVGLPSDQIRGRAFEQIGYVSENQELPGWMTLRAFLAYLRPFYPTWDHELERNLLAQFRLPEEQKLRSMSRGQQMKAALLSALAYRPALLVLDEPFSGLDPLARDEFIEGLLDRIAAEDKRPMTVLLSSHDLAEIESFSTHVAYLDNGRLLFAEEIGSLTERFREVTVIFDGESQSPVTLTKKPASWLLPEPSPAALRFVHSQAAAEPVEQQITALFPQAGQIQVEPMSLRAIFLALARSNAPQPVSANAGSRP